MSTHEKSTSACARSPGGKLPLFPARLGAFWEMPAFLFYGLTWVPPLDCPIS